MIAQNIVSHPNGNFKNFLGPPSSANFVPSPVSPNEIIKLLTSMKPKKSTDINGLNTDILKHVKLELSYVLAWLFSRSFLIGHFPTQSKISKIIPLYKNKNDELDLNNYRGISLIETVGKVLEKLMHKRLYSYLEKNKLLYELQYGFRKQLGVDICLIKLLNKLSEAFNSQRISAVLSLDCMKAFDMVSWPILFYKLSHMGVRGPALSFFKSYFQDRSSKICVNDVLCEGVCKLKRGVCQGSCLGPLLFLIYINDLPNAVKILSSILFADDNQLVASAERWEDLVNNINLELKNVVDWYVCNLLPIHPQKTSLTFFVPNSINAKFKLPLDTSGNLLYKIQVDMNLDPSLPYDINQVFPVHITNLNKNECDGGVRILGVIFDPELNFKYQADLVIAKQKSSLFGLKQAKKFLDTEHLLNLFQAFNRSYLNFSIPFIGTCNDNIISSINKMDRAAVRVIFGLRYFQPVSHIYKANNLLNVDQLIQGYKYKFMFKYENNLIGPSFNNQWKKVQDRINNHNIRSRDQYDLPVRIQYLHLKKFPFFSFPNAYNSLPSNIKNANKFITFTNRIKRFFLGLPLEIDEDVSGPGSRP